MTVETITEIGGNAKSAAAHVDSGHSLIIPEIGLTEVDGEPRARDLDLAERLGFDRPRKIRELIKNHLAEIEGFGPTPRRRAMVGIGSGAVRTDQDLHRMASRPLRCGAGGRSLGRDPQGLDVWLYPRGFAALYMADRGRALVTDHNDRVMGQGIIKFPSAKPREDA